MALAGNRRNLFSLGVFASTFLASAFGAAFLLAHGTGHAQLLRGYEPATAKSQPGDDAARAAPHYSGASNELDGASPLAEGSRAKVFVPPERPRSDRRREGKPDRANEGGTALSDDPSPTLQWDRDAIVDAVRDGGQKRIDLARSVPVAWIYLDAWASADGTVHYRP